ncbi:ABC transporter substrate-binding protein [Rhodobacter ferrooxidans]|uniref:Extracellular solute-binding protein family 1 n=1 Tax=Rhodobacter ferrooxidans TaxID=371731 RepID=C8S155_9RHOB|nr:extracellular solute-binding protein [Rhodobacter sp. SW2]EEW25253.1 extracellular solute-binding protein family 1 [Rhodobacter sp. SW2]
MTKAENFEAASGLKRRSVLKGGAALGLAGVAGSGLVGRALAAEPHPLAGQKIEMNILGIAGWGPSSLGVAMSPLFAEYVKAKYDYDVTFQFQEAPFADLFQKAATSLATKSQEFNIIISDSQWLGALAQPGWILNLNEIIKANPNLQLEWYSKAVVDTYMTYPDGSDQIWGLPQEGDVEALFVRKDWLEDPAERAAFEAKHGKPMPQTWEDFAELTMDEFELLADFFTRPDKQVWGFAQQYSRVYDFATCAFNNFLWSRGGRTWDATTGQVEGILNTPENAASLAEYKRWLKYCPPGATNIGIGEGVDVFVQGKVFSEIQWAAVGPAMIPEELKGKVLVVPPPKHGTGADAKRIMSMGGQPWVVNAFNDDAHMRVAIDFMNWWYLPETALEFAKRGGNPCDKATLSRPDFDDINPWNRTFKYMLEDGRSQDFWHDPKYSEMLAIQQEGYSAFVTDQATDPQAVMDYIACAQQQILLDSGTSKIEPSAMCAGTSL